MDLHLEITQSKNWSKKLPRIRNLIDKVTRQTLYDLNLTDYLSEVELSILLTNDNSIQQLNEQYRNINKPTNVLSFISEENNFKDTLFLKAKSYIMLGDIAFSFDTILKESTDQDKAFHDHFCHLLVHGLLHLLGHDHAIEREALIMEQIEIKILENLEISSPYEH